MPGAFPERAKGLPKLRFQILSLNPFLQVIPAPQNKLDDSGDKQLITQGDTARCGFIGDKGDVLPLHRGKRGDPASDQLVHTVPIKIGLGGQGFLRVFGVQREILDPDAVPVRESGWPSCLNKAPDDKVSQRPHRTDPQGTVLLEIDTAWR